MRDDPPSGLAGFADAIRTSDGVVVISPEYHGSLPGVLKNALDYIRGEWQRKPVGIVTLSSGSFGGVLVHNHLQLLLLRVGALPVAGMPVSNVGTSFSAGGEALDERYEKNFGRFVETLLWYVRAIGRAVAAESAERSPATG